MIQLNVINSRLQYEKSELKHTFRIHSSYVQMLSQHDSTHWGEMWGHCSVVQKRRRTAILPATPAQCAVYFFKILCILRFPA